jgi:hypothetical protein
VSIGHVLLALSCASLLFAAACGSGGGALATVAPCPTPAPLPTARRGNFTDGPYLAQVNTYVDRLMQLREEERAKYPDRTYSSSDDFRVTFAAYADDTICTATNVIALQPAAPGTAACKTALDAAVNAYIDHTKAGRDAVKSRNVSDYRRWYDGVDAKLQAVMTAARSSFNGTPARRGP